MPITFPRDMPPELGIQELSFVLEPMQELAPLRSGRAIAKNLGPSLWHMAAQIVPLNNAAMGVLRAWFNTLESVEHFYAFDRDRCYPLLHPGHTGTATLSNVTDGKMVALGGLPPGFTLSLGDYIAFNYGSLPSRALHRIVEGGSANGSGNVTVEVRPHVRTGWAASATVFLEKPAARMLIIPGSYSETVGPDRFGRVSFQAVQSL